MEVNGYALSMETTINNVCIADVLVESLNYWYDVAKKALYKNFNRTCYFEDLITDLYIRLKKAADNAELKAFAYSKTDAKRIIGELVKQYACSKKYVAKLEDFDKATQATGQELTFCSLEAFNDSLSETDIEALENDESSFVGLDVHFAREDAQKFANAWDSMNDDGEMTVNEKIKLLSEMAVTYKSLTTEAEKSALVNTARYLLNLNEDTPDELKKAFYTLVSV